MQSRDPLQIDNPDRRRLMVLGVGAFVAAAVPFARNGKQLVRRDVPVMGTLAEIAIVHADPAYAHGAIDAAVEQMRSVERTMSRFVAESDVGRVNAVAGRGEVAVSEATARVIEESVRWAVASEGRFDPCYGRAVELWDVTNRTAPPPRHVARRLASRALYRSLILDRTRHGPVVSLEDADAAIDLGGIGKGYGVDRAVAALRDWGIGDGIVNVGGDLYALGESEDGNPWRIGVRKAADPTDLDGMFEVADAAVATSGDYLRFFKHRGQRYHHLLDPATGEPRSSTGHSVTVTAGSCMCADAAATTVFGMERHQADRLLQIAAPDAMIINAA